MKHIPSMLMLMSYLMLIPIIFALLIGENLLPIVVICVFYGSMFIILQVLSRL